MVMNTRRHVCKVQMPKREATRTELVAKSQTNEEIRVSSATEIVESSCKYTLVYYF